MMSPSLDKISGDAYLLEQRGAAPPPPVIPTILIFSDGQVSRSTNGGTTWNLVSHGVAGEPRACAFGSDTFVAVLRNTSKAIYSRDNGATWTSTSTINSRLWVDCAFGAGVFIAVSSSSSTGIRSSDGITWTEFTLPDGGYNGIRFIGTRFYLYGVNLIRYSTDGTNWTQVSALGSISVSSVMFNGSLYIAPGFSGSTWRTSSDGINFSSATAPSTLGFAAGAAIGTRFNVMPFANSFTVYTSTNGTTWTTNSLSLAVFPQQIAVGNNNFYILDANTNNFVYRSTNGTSWTSVAISANAQWVGFAASG